MYIDVPKGSLGFPGDPLGDPQVPMDTLVLGHM